MVTMLCWVIDIFFYNPCVEIVYLSWNKNVLFDQSNLLMVFKHKWITLILKIKSTLMYKLTKKY